MRQVQEALKNIGIPVFPDVWRPAGPDQNPPAQYCVYTTSLVPDDDWDDDMRVTRTYVYMSMWSEGDPTDMAARIRTAMRAAGFGMIEQETGSGLSTHYDETTAQYSVHWTFVLYEEV